MPPIEIILNASSGRPEHTVTREVLSEIFARHAIETRIHKARTGTDIVDLARRAAESTSEIVVAGGGDGTISTVAGTLLEGGKKLGVLPLGTLNHFARDLKIPTDLEAAVGVIAAGHVLQVDVGEVNGRTFINNSSLGLYPEMVRGRERRQRLGYGKWNSLLRSALAVFRRYPLLDIRLEAEGKQDNSRTPFIFIGNNEYKIEGFNIGGRERLDQGRLSIYMTRGTDRLVLVRIALKAVFSRLSQEKDFLSAVTQEVLVETRHSHLRVATDGEVLIMETPLRYRIRARALPVIVPGEDAQGEVIR